jgi:hypothetical protein
MLVRWSRRMGLFVGDISEYSHPQPISLCKIYIGEGGKQ